MNDLYLASDSVTVYPASNRDPNIDRYAKLNIEHNLINFVNRLTGVDSFIIEGLHIGSGIIGAGSCNIHGFLFNLSERSLPSLERDKYLCLKIRVYVDDADKEHLANVADDTLNQAEDNGSNKFTGICLSTYTEDAMNNVIAPYYILPIAFGGNDGWEEIKYEDGTNTNRAFEQLFTADQILIKSEQTSNEFGSKSQSLLTFLEKNYVIDDGEID